MCNGHLANPLQLLAMACLCTFVAVRYQQGTRKFTELIVPGK